MWNKEQSVKKNNEEFTNHLKTMSTNENTIYLEAKADDFHKSESRVSRLKILAELKEQGFTKEAEDLREDWFQERHDWLKDQGAGINDVLSDEDGEYFMDETWGEDSGEVKAVRLPDYLQDLPEK